MPDIAMALIVGFVVGLLVGFIIRSEPQRVEAELKGQDHAEQ